jgi:hypothetical protein
MGSSQSTIEVNDFSLGMNSFLSNDSFPLKNGASNMWRLAQDARIATLGDYENRKGFDFHSDAAGVTLDQSITSTTGAADQSFSTTIRLAQKFTAGANGRIPKLAPRLKNDASATGTILIEYWTDSSGSPGTLISRSSIAASTPTGSYADAIARYPDAPAQVSGTSYWIVAYVQNVGSGSYKWSSTTSATTAKVSTDSGATWSSTSYALNFKQYYATTGGVKGFHRAYKSDGTKVTLFAHGTVLYSVDNSTGALTTVKSSLNASATQYRFVTINDIVYYVNGYDGLRKWNFTTESQITATNYTHITEHKGLLVLVASLDPNELVYSNFADYEVFTSTDTIDVPSPKTGDPIAAIQSINGYLDIRTLNNNFILSGDDNATFSLDEAPDQKGTYTQETTTADKNFMYFLSDDGVYKSNGSEPVLLSDNNYQDIVSLANKETCCLTVNKGRLYLWYRSTGAAANDSCYVWNLNYGQNGAECIESNDTNAYVGRAMSAFRDTDDLIVASSLIGQVYWQEQSTNDNTNLGGDINFMVQTHYMTFGSPAVLKEIRYWEPRFGAQSGSYTMSCEYATDLRDNWQVYSSPNVQGAGSLWGASTTIWGAFTWGTTAEVQSYLYVPGEYRRIALRYKHYGTRQPNSFLGHTLRVQSRRLR